MTGRDQDVAQVDADIEHDRAERVGQHSPVFPGGLKPSAQWRRARRRQAPAEKNAAARTEGRHLADDQTEYDVAFETLRLLKNTLQERGILKPAPRRRPDKVRARVTEALSQIGRTSDVLRPEIDVDLVAHGHVLTR